MVRERVIEKFRNEWNTLFTCVFPGEILYRTSKKYNERLVYFYTKKTKKPFAVAKIAIYPNLYGALRNEFDTLVTLFKPQEGYCLSKIPRPLFKIECDEGMAIVMSYVDGKGVDSYSNGWSGLGMTRKKLAEQVFTNVLEWWNSFLEHAPAKSNKAPALVVERHERIMELFAARYPKDGALYDELCRLEQDLLPIADKVKFGISHGDLWKGNILVDKEGSVYILDWERSSNCSILANDMFLFLTSFYARGDYYTDMVGNFVDGSSRNIGIRRAINSISETVDMPVPGLRILYELFLFEMSVQGLIHFGEFSVYDIEWKKRLEFFLDNKAAIFNGSF